MYMCVYIYIFPSRPFRNCNHFAYDLCLRLVGRPPPGWINRLAYVATYVPCVNQSSALGTESKSAEEPSFPKRVVNESVGWRALLAQSLSTFVKKASAIVARREPLPLSPAVSSTYLPIQTKDDYVVPRGTPTSYAAATFVNASAIQHDGRYVVSMPTAAYTGTAVAGERERERQVMSQLHGASTPAARSGELLTNNPQDVLSREHRLYSQEENKKPKSLLANLMHGMD
jgi:hypothetical protein